MRRRVISHLVSLSSDERLSNFLLMLSRSHAPGAKFSCSLNQIRSTPVTIRFWPAMYETSDFFHQSTAASSSAVRAIEHVMLP